MNQKKFKLSAEEIKPLIPPMGGCIASDMITVDGNPVLFMYREAPSNKFDSGWRFLSGLEEDEYMNDSRNHPVYDVNTIANCDPGIIPLLEAPTGSVYERASRTELFEQVTDWSPPNE